MCIPAPLTLFVHPSIIDEFYSYRFLNIKSLQLTSRLHPNEFIILRDELGTSKSALLKVSQDGVRLEPLYPEQ